jgi:hypothetical protein
VAGQSGKKEKGWWQMTEKIKTICAWCDKVIQEGELIDGNPSHGICPDCFEIQRAEGRKQMAALQKIVKWKSQ